MDKKELKASHTFHFGSVSVDGRVCVTYLRPLVVHSEFLGLLGVKCQIVVGTPHCQLLNLHPVGRFIVIADQANHRGVVCKLDYGIRAMYRYAVMGEEGAEDWA